MRAHVTRAYHVTGADRVRAWTAVGSWGSATERRARAAATRTKGSSSSRPVLASISTTCSAASTHTRRTKMRHPSCLPPLPLFRPRVSACFALLCPCVPSSLSSSSFLSLPSPSLCLSASLPPCLAISEPSAPPPLRSGRALLSPCRRRGQRPSRARTPPAAARAGPCRTAPSTPPPAAPRLISCCLCAQTRCISSASARQ
eukprot:3903890-Rhodomonas_salina.1